MPDSPTYVVVEVVKGRLYYPAAFIRETLNHVVLRRFGQKNESKVHQRRFVPLLWTRSSTLAGAVADELTRKIAEVNATRDAAVASLIDSARGFADAEDPRKRFSK